MLRKPIPFLLLLLMASCSILEPIPEPKREFRGFWVATVANIDWPKNGTDAIEKQKADFLDILDFYQDLNFNAAIVQVRTAGDAFYHSNYAPWSRFLTGTEGKAQEAHEDLLHWMIAQTHNRGMEFHAWLNPYRSTFDLNTEILSANHDYYLHPEWMIKYGNKFYYNPGLPQVQQRLVSIMEELAVHYDIDAIHFDDYFYPYKINGEVFNDSLTFAHYAFSGQSLGDWRRSNVDSLIKRIHKTIKAKKPWVQFGVSPFGVWKNKSTDPNGSDTKAGQTTYEDLYADPLLWIKNGWLDYIVPQVYWSMDLSVASHKTIVEWWAGQNAKTNLYVGNGAYKVRNNSDQAWDKRKELPNQLKLARKNEAVLGNVFFSAKSLKNNNLDVVAYLKRKFYGHDALPPAPPAISTGSTTGVPLRLDFSDKDWIGFDTSSLRDVNYLLVYKSGKRLKSEYSMKKLIAKLPIQEMDLLNLDKKTVEGHRYIAFTTLDKYRRESQPILVNLQKTNLDDSKK